MRTAARRAVLGLLVLLLLCLAWTGVELNRARGELTQAQRLLEQVQQDRDRASAEPLLAQAQERLEAAAARLRRPGPQVVGALPVVGRTVVAARDTAAAGAAVVEGGRGVLAALPEDLLAAGRFDLDALGAVESALRDAARDARDPVARLDDLELGATPRAVSSGAEQARVELSGVPDALARAADGLAALQGLLGAERERRLLVVLQNNAELRATGGLISVFAEASVRDGVIRLAGFQEVEAVADLPDEVRQVPRPDDYAALFDPFKAGTTLWKNVNMSPDVPTSSQVLANVAAASLPQAPDAVLWVDVPAIAAVLRATGPVQLPDGTTLSADNAVAQLLSTAYAEAGGTFEDQERRRDALRAAADAVLGQLLSPGAAAPADALAMELAPAAAGRHLALWSSDSEEQRLLESARLAGSVVADDDLLSFAVHNLGDTAGFGNKLDYYGRRQVTVRVEVDRDAALVEHEVALRNTAPATGLPEYVAGLKGPGTANAFVTHAVPRDAEQIAFARNGASLEALPRPLADHGVLTDAVRVPPGATVTWRVSYRVPLEDGRYTSRLFPQPLAVDAGLSLEVVAAAGLELSPAPLTVSGPFARMTAVDVVAERPPWRERFSESVRRFWNEPVRLPW